MGFPILGNWDLGGRLLARGPQELNNMEARPYKAWDDMTGNAGGFETQFAKGEQDAVDRRRRINDYIASNNAQFQSPAPPQAPQSPWAQMGNK